MPLINCKTHLELNWNNNCVIYGADAYNVADKNNTGTTFEITSTKLYVPIVTLSTKYNINLTKQLNKGFQRSIHWNKYKSKIETKEANNQTFTRLPLDASFQGVNRLFVLCYNNTDNNANKVGRDSPRKYFLPRVNITNYKVLIDGRNSYDQPINDHINRKR